MTEEFFTSNRNALVDKLNGGVIVLTAYTKMQRGNDVAFRFEQEANFWWLTGVESADWWIIIDGSRHKSWLVAPDVAEVHEIFDGVLDPVQAKKISGIDSVVSNEEALGVLRDLAKKHSVVYAPGEHPHKEYFDFIQNPAPKKLGELLRRYFSSVQDCRKELAQLRAIKQPQEIAQMKKAINLTVDTFAAIKPRLNDLSYEYEVEAEFTHYFLKNNARHAYEPIIASGKHACTMHYEANNAKLKKRELLLMDIGARVGGYAADITRTYALGEPTKRQIEVHMALQSAQKQIIASIAPHLLIEEYQKNVDKIMTDALLSLGLMSDKNDQDSYRKYFPHAVSHGLGVDVHDALGAPRMLQSGMVLTVEPGIYIPKEGIGVRLEDDILVTEDGNTNLSARLSTDL